MNNKKAFGLALGALLLALGFPAEAQQPKKVPRIGYLASSDAATASAGTEGLRLALRELGYIEGQNIATEYRYAEGKFDRAPQIAAELVRLKVDIIVVTGGTLRWVRAAMNATNAIPIVMTGAGADPVEAGLVESLARPGGNVTGITNIGRELGGKRLELLKEAVPKVARVAVLYDPASPHYVLDLWAGTHSLETVKGQCIQGERDSPGRGAWARINYSVLGGTRHGRFRACIRWAR